LVVPDPEPDGERSDDWSLPQAARKPKSASAVVGSCRVMRFLEGLCGKLKYPEHWYRDASKTRRA
jgi:hypothetical protein